MPIKQLVAECKMKMEKAVAVLHDELKAFRSGRASPALVENIKVDYYGAATPLKSLATISTPQADTLVIKPFDPASVKEIEKAIKNSELSIAPIAEGKFIRLNIPPLSEERRKQLVHQAKQAGEQTKISVRNVRRDAIKELEKEQKDKTITEDDLDHGKKQLDDLTKEYSDKVDGLVKHKSDEIMLE
jgi:ribosome recycling factor